MSFFKRFFYLVLALLGSMSITLSHASELDPMNLPKISHFVEDFSHVLSESEINTLSSQAQKIQENTKYQLAVVLFPNRNGVELADIGLKIFRDNKLGDAKRNDGILLVIATEEKKIRIITGYGAEWAIPDVLAKQIIEAIRGDITAGNYTSGITQFYTKAEKYLESPSQNKEPSPFIILYIFLGIFGFFLTIFIVAYFIGGWAAVIATLEFMRKNWKGGGSWWGWFGWGGGGGFSGGGGSSGWWGAWD